MYHYEEWRCTRELRAILIPRIKQQIGAEQATTRKTVVQLAMKEVSDEKKTDTSRASISEIVEDVFGMTRLFLFAGHDTTATIITWSFHYLSKNPHVLELLRAEHNKVFGPDPSTVSEAMRRSPQLLNSIPYTLAVAKEVLRLSPLAASIRRGSRNLFLAHGEALLPTDGFAVITGTAMIDYHPDLWPRVNEFLPERWVVPPGDPLYPSKPGQWRPFEYGAMNCIGQELSMIEIKLVLLYVVRELDIEPAFQEWDKLP